MGCMGMRREGFSGAGGWTAGSVVAHGVDVCECGRIASVLARHGGRFVDRVFTDAEAVYAGENAKRRAERLAARFAAKEAAMKALGTGWAEGVGWRDVWVERGASGEPRLVVAGAAGEIAARRGIGGWLVSLSHTRTVAMASVIGLASG